MQLNLHKLKGEYSILKLDSLPDVRAIDGFFALTRTDDEISLVCLNSEADKLNPYARENDYQVLRVAGQLDFSLVGILARMTGALAGAGIPVCAVSTYDTDYLLIRVCLKNSLIRNFGRRCAISASSILDLALLSLRIYSLN